MKFATFIILMAAIVSAVAANGQIKVFESDNCSGGALVFNEAPPPSHNGGFVAIDGVNDSVFVTGVDSGYSFMVSMDKHCNSGAFDASEGACHDRADGRKTFSYN